MTNSQSHQLFLFRHGETDWNKSRRWQGHTDTDLNETGIKQAHELYKILKNTGIEAIYSSDLKRAVDTAVILNSYMSVPLFYDPGIRETSFGVAEGFTTEELEQKFGEEFVNRWKSKTGQDLDINFPKGESKREMLGRVIDSIQTFFVRNNLRRVGVCTHGGVIRRLMETFATDIPIPSPIPNCQVFEMQYNSLDNSWKFIKAHF